MKVVVEEFAIKFPLAAQFSDMVVLVFDFSGISLSSFSSNVLWADL